MYIFLFPLKTDASVSSDSLAPHKDFVYGSWDKVLADCASKEL